MEQTNNPNDINQPVETSSINPINPKPNNIYKYLFFVTLILLFGLVVYLYINTSKNNNSQLLSNTIMMDVAEPTLTQTNDPKNEINKIPDGWIEYKNEDLNFAFYYPKEYGEVKESSTYGSEGDYGKLFTFSFNDKNCPTSFCGKVIEMGAAAPNFGGIGTGRAMAISAGYYKNKDGSVTERLLSRKFGEWDSKYLKNFSWYDPWTIENSANIDIKITKYTPTYFQGDYLEGVLQKIEHNDYHVDDILTVTFNLGHNPFDITGFQFMTFDEPGETKNAESLKSVAKTFRLLN